jgi:hypothetical protein
VLATPSTADTANCEKASFVFEGRLV